MKTLTLSYASAFLVAFCCVTDVSAAVLDRTFRPGTGLNGGDETSGNVVVPLPDGRILLGGDFSGYNGVRRPNLVRLHPDGSLDQTLRLSAIEGPLGESPIIRAAGLQPDGKIIVSGAFRGISGVARPGIARLHPDGTLDTTWVPQFRQMGNAFESFVLRDGRILAWHPGGMWTGGAIERLNADGSPDTNFTVYLHYLMLRAVSFQADGRILIAGTLFDGTGITGQRLARLNPDGSDDISFTPPTFGPDRGGPTGVGGAEQMRDGRILVFGNFTTVDGRVRSGLALLHSNGRLDITARFPATLGHVVQVQPLSDGSIVAYSVGESTSPNHSEVTLFTEPPGGQRLKGRPWRTEFTVFPNEGVYDISEDARGRILIAGGFWEINGVRGATGIARLRRR
jgi:uncharacterized delta-60 repeat protein